MPSIGTEKRRREAGAKSPAVPINAAIPNAMEEAGALPATPIIRDSINDSEFPLSVVLIEGGASWAGEPDRALDQSRHGRIFDRGWHRPILAIGKLAQ